MNREVVGKVLVLVVFLTTFWFSSKPVEVSKGQSNGILVRLKIITQEDITNKTPKYIFWGRGIRKLAHFGLFAIAGVGALMATGSFVKSILIVCLMGIFDEVHQYFVPGRGAQVKDVILDIFGGSAGTAFTEAARNLQIAYRKRVRLIYK